MSYWTLFSLLDCLTHYAERPEGVVLSRCVELVETLPRGSRNPGLHRAQTFGTVRNISVLFGSAATL